MPLPKADIFSSLSALESQSMLIASSADRNLLFGILAWQSGVVSETHLLEAMKRWTFEKHRRLSEILLELRALTAQQIQLLDPMVEAQIQLHEGKPSSALESMSSQPGIAKTLIRHIADQDVLACLNRCASRQGNSTLAKSAAEAGAEVQRYTGLRYIPQQLHAEGGLGAVYKATDSELNREVALKEIRPEFAGHAESRARFVLEAEVTGGLEHPGIVPVYGLGHHDDGRPFYAMRFIRGRSLKEAIDQFHQTSSIGSPELRGTLGGALDESVSGGTESVKQKAGEAKTTNGKGTTGSIGPDFSGLEFRKLLGRFIDVCQAVGYAHSRGVLHRDLKPGNIMLGKYGETLVVDWGLAKVQGRTESASVPGEMTLQPSSGSGVTPTIAGQAMGTPAYMPPEQAAGRLDQLGPASDVYSLGATLYHLLTGKAPFRSGDVATLLQDVRSGKFPAPRTVQPSIPSSMQAVCLKAMSLRSADRYGSLEKLAEDLERFLADEPVYALTEPLIVRARRWMRKHQTLTTTTAAMLLVSAIGLAVFSAVVSGKNRDLAIARQTAETNEQTAEEQRDLAQQNEKAAREQSQLALSTLTSVIQDIQGGLRDLPGAGEVRRRLLATSLEKLKFVSREWVEQAAVERSTWQALNDMGDVILTFGMDPENAEAMSGADRELSSESQSAAELAESYYQRAFSIARTRVEADPNDTEKQHDLSSSYHVLGEVYVKLGRTGDALANFEADMRISRALADADPNNKQLQRRLSLTYIKLGDLCFKLSRTNNGIALYEDAMKIRRSLAEADPSDVANQRNLAISHERLGDVLTRLGRADEARKQYEAEFQIASALAASDPGNARKQRLVTVSCNKLGDVLLTLGRTDEALGKYEEGMKIRRALAEADPDDSDKQADLSFSYNRLGQVYLKLSRTNDALAAFQANMKICRSLAEADPGNAVKQVDLGISCGWLGEVYQKLGRTNDALKLYAEGLDINRTLSEADPRDSEKQRRLSCSYNDLGHIFLNSGRMDEALAQFEAAMKIRRLLSEADPLDTEKQYNLAVSYDYLGDVFLEHDRTNDALATFEAGANIFGMLAEVDPGNTEKQRSLSISYKNLGDVFLKLGRMDEALGKYEDSLKIRRGLAEADPGNAQKQRELSESHRKLAQTRMARDEFSLAAESFEAAASVLRSMIEQEMDAEKTAFELTIIENEVRSSRLAMIAMGDLESVLKRPAEELPALLDTRGILLSKRSRFSDAAQAATKLRELEQADKGQLYNAACVFSLCAESIKASDATELTAEQTAQRNSWIHEALATLKLAVEKGWKDFTHMQQDRDLAPLRELPEFKALIPVDAPASPAAAKE